MSTHWRNTLILGLCLMGVHCGEDDSSDGGNTSSNTDTTSSSESTSSGETSSSTDTSSSESTSSSETSSSSETTTDTLPTDVPTITCETNGDQGNLADGSVFLSNFTLSTEITTESYLLTVDNSCEVTNAIDPSTVIAADFKEIKDGYYSYYKSVGKSAGGLDTFEIHLLDSSFTDTGIVYKAGNGYITDSHEFRLTGEVDGSAWLFGNKIAQYDFSECCEGESCGIEAMVLHMAVQKVLPAGSDGKAEVLWQWESENVIDPCNDTTQDIKNSIVNQDELIDYIHSNALEIDTDGHLLLSSRHLDEVSKICFNPDGTADCTDGEFIWRLGGINAKHTTDFTWLNDSLEEQGYTDHDYYEDPSAVFGFSHQHAVRRLENGHITLFDNGDLKSNQYPDGVTSCWDATFTSCEFTSRAVEYEIDEDAMTIEKVWEYNEGVTSTEMGYVQRLSNGNTLIGWGGNHPSGNALAATEVMTNWDTNENTWLMRWYMPYEIVSYRAYKFDDP